jgi:hypothetical protein
MAGSPISAVTETPISVESPPPDEIEPKTRANVHAKVLQAKIDNLDVAIRNLTPGLGERVDQRA